MRNAVQTQELHSALSSQQNRFLQILKDLGAHQTPHFLLDAPVRCPDRILQMCTPSLKYPPSDARPTLRFTGGLGPAHRTAEIPLKDQSSWWEELLANSKLGDGERKRVVAVTQGTIRPNQSELLLPTLQALSSLDNVLTIAILGRRSASLPENALVPSNVRMADFVPYDAILPFCDVFVTNGGYGSFSML